MGAPGQAVLCGSRLASADRTWLDVEDASKTDWVVGDDFILAFAVETESGLKCASTLQVQWRNVTDAGSFVALGASGELTYSGDTNLVDGDAVTSGEAGCTPSGSQTWQDGEELEGANDGAFNTGASTNYWSEYHIAIDGANMLGSKQYEFRIWDVSEGVSAGTCSAKITTAATVEDINIGSGGGLYDSAAVDDDTLSLAFELVPDVYDEVAITEDNPVTVESAPSVNDFTTDQFCVALWNYETSPGFLIDGIGGNDLTNISSVPVETTVVKVGDQSVYFEGNSGNALARTDTNLDSGFPWRDADATPEKSFTICLWVRVKVLPTTKGFDGYLVSKYAAAGNLRGFSFWLPKEDNKPSLKLGYSSGTLNENVQFSTGLSANIWYHIGVTYDHPTKAYRIRVWDDNASALLDDDATGVFTVESDTQDVPVTLGADGACLGVLDGYLDETVIFNRVLSADEIDDIRTSSFRSVSTSVNDSVAVAEDKTVFIQEDVDISVFDATSIAEDVQRAIELVPTAYDEVALSEDIQRDIELVPTVFDSITVEESTDLAQELVPTVYDEVTLTEDAPVEIGALPPLDVDIFDASSVAEDIQRAIELVPDVYDEVSLTEDIQRAIELVPDVYDETSIAEDTQRALGLAPDVFDATAVEDVGVASLGEIEAISIDVYEEVAIAEMYAGGSPSEWHSDSSEYTAGVQVTGWTERWSTANADFKPITTAGIGSQSFRNYCSSSGGYYLITKDDYNAQNVEILARVNASSDINHIIRLYARCSGLVAARTGYFAYIQPLNDSIGLQRYDNAVSTNLDYTPITIDINTWYWLRFKIFGDVLQAKCWSGLISDEPEEWNLDLTDSDIAASGWTGVGCYTDSGDSGWYDYISIAINGAENVLPVLPDVHDSPSIAEDISVSFFQSVDISVYDSAAVTEDVDLLYTYAITISVFDGVTVAEDVPVEYFSDVWLSVFDSVAITEATDRYVLLKKYNIDLVSVAEDVTAEITYAPVEIDIYDSVSVAEEVTAAPDLVLSVNDSIGTADRLGVSDNYYHMTDFSEYPTGSPPSDWSEHWHTDVASATIEEDPTAIGGKVLHITWSSQDRFALAWDYNVNLGHGNILIHAKGSALDMFNAITGIDNDPLGEIGMLAGSDIENVTNYFAHTTWYKGDDTSVPAAAKTVSPDTWYWIEMFSEVGLSLARVWEGDYYSRPGSADTKIGGLYFGVGQVGVGGVPRSAGEQHLYIDFFEFRTTSVSTSQGPTLPEVYDSASITEDITPNVDLNPSVYDTISLAEYINAATEFLPLTVFDEVSIAESTPVEYGVGSITLNLYESVNITEAVSGVASAVILAVVDSMVVTDIVTAGTDALEAVVHTSVGVFESVSAEAHCAISVNDTVTVADVVSVLEVFLISLYDASGVAEIIACQGSGLNINSSVDVGITESISVYWILAEGELFCTAEGMAASVIARGLMADCVATGMAPSITGRSN